MTRALETQVRRTIRAVRDAGERGPIEIHLDNVLVRILPGQGKEATDDPFALVEMKR
jgi:hypothetical protein